MAFLILLFSFMAFGPYAVIARYSTSELVNTITFYTAINGSCSNTSELSTKQKEIFDNCQTTDINQKITLTKDNAQDVLCLLYYNRIISYCQSEPKQFEYPTLVEVTSKHYEVPNICKNILEYSSRSIKENACFHLCTDTLGNIKPECLLFHYYDTLLKNTASLITPADTSKSSVSNKGDSGGSVSKPDGLQASPVINQPVASLTDQKPPPALKPVQVIDSNTNKNMASAQSQEDGVTDEVKLDHSGSKPNEAAEPKKPLKKPPKNPMGKPEVEGQSLHNSTVNNGSSGKVIPSITITRIDLPMDRPQMQSMKPNTSRTGVSLPIIESGNGDQVPKPTEPKEPKPSDNGQSGVVVGPVPIKAADEIKPKETPPKLENGDSDIEDGEGQHGVPDGDYMAEGESPPDEDIPQQQPAQEAKQMISDRKPDTLQGNPINTDNIDEINGESYFMSYFMIVCVIIVLGYVGYHNRIKVMALLLEGKRNRRPYRGRRPNSANYHKLDSNLEEAISSNVTKNSNNVIY